MGASVGTVEIVAAHRIGIAHNADSIRIDFGGFGASLHLYHLSRGRVVGDGTSLVTIRPILTAPWPTRAGSPMGGF